MASLILSGSTSGSVTLSSPAVSGTTTLTLPTTSGTVLTSASSQVTGPAFSAYLGSTQTISTGTFTKLQFNTEIFDTASAYDSTTNYRFTPQVAGYYQVNGSCRINQPAAGGEVFVDLYKNGSEVVRGSDSYIASTGGFITVSISYLIQMNGSTDYIELYIYQGSGVSQTTQNGSALTFFQAAMVRSA
jgi:hypothetical protein